MAGYYGYSMSNNAMDAYDEGKRPLSQWDKSAMVRALNKAVADKEISVELADWFKKVPLWFFKEVALRSDEWHHSSSYFNKVDFYELNVDALVGHQDISFWQKWLDILRSSRKAEKERAKAERRARCKYLTWSGSRRHPKATEHEAEGVIRGDWFYPEGEDFKKNIYANGFEILE